MHIRDLSRFGRDYLKVGFYSEILFPKFEVRLVAVHDNVDTDLGENDLAPIVNLFNEWFVKSTSRKVRAIINAKGKSGERIAVVPLYGYAGVIIGISPRKPLIAGVSPT